MKAAKKALAFIVTLCMILMLLPPYALAADIHDAGTAEELTAALGEAASGDDIRLTADIDYPNGITIDGRTITFDLNGHTLNATNASGNALSVGSGGVVNVSGSGAFNAASSADNSNGVYTHDGGQATVTSAAASGNSGHGAYAQGTGSSVHVTGDATSPTGIGAYATDGGKVNVDGDAEGYYSGAEVANSGSEVHVGRNAVGTSGYGYAVWADGGLVEVGGNATGAYAVVSMSGGTVRVTGDVTSSGASASGVYAIDGGTATIDGTITAPVYITLQSIERTAADGTPGTTPWQDYLIYTDGSNTVRVQGAVKIGTTVYLTLDAALASVAKWDVKTILLLQDIDYNGRISIWDKIITFDLNGNTLNVTNTSGTALYVGSGGIVNVNGSGAFDVTGTWFGVDADNGGQATVTNATATATSGIGAYALGAGSSVHLQGNATALAGNGATAHSGGTVRVDGDAIAPAGIGASAYFGGTVRVDGNAEGNIGADVYESGSAIYVGHNAEGISQGVTNCRGLAEVGGNATGDTALYNYGGTIRVSGDTAGTAYTSGGGTTDIGGNVNASGDHTIAVDVKWTSTVHVSGNVTASGDSSIGVETAGNSTVHVSGNVTASGFSSGGVYAIDGGTAIIDGTITAPVYIMLQNTIKPAADGVPGTAPWEDYLIHTDGSNTVRVGYPPVFPISAAFDKNPANQADVDTNIMKEAASVTDVKAGGVSIGTGNYSLSGDTLTIRKEYLAGQTVGELTLSIELDTGDTVNLTITISDSTPPISATIDPVSAMFDKNPAKRADVMTAIAWNDAHSVTDVKAGGVSIGTGNYSVSGDTLTIKKEYLAAQARGDLTLSIEFDRGSPATLTISIGDTTPTDFITDIMIRGGTPGTVFDPGVTKYTVTLDEHTATFNIDIARANPRNKVYMNGRLVTTGRLYALNPGCKRVVTIKIVTPQHKTKTYKVTFIRDKSTDADLAGLDVKGDSIQPAFDKNTCSYTLNVPAGRKSIKVSIKADDKYQWISINGRIAKSRTITLKKDQPTTVTIIVKAQAGNMKVYTLTVTRSTI